MEKSTTIGNIEELIDRVRTSAENEARTIRQRAAKAAERDLQRARAEWKEKLTEEEQRVKAEILNRRQAAAAEIAVSAQRRIMQYCQNAIDKVFSNALRKLADFDDDDVRFSLLIRLTREGAEKLKCNRVKVRLNEKEKQLVGSRDFAAATGLNLTLDEKTAETAGGPIVSDSTGRVVYENNFEARLERITDRLRTKTAELLGFQK